jgi:hypothetical protein
MGKSSLCHLIYYSRNSLAGDAGARSVQLAQIVKSAQKKNEFSVITSFLISDRDWFLQVLEGDRTDLIAALQRITTDQRHRDILIVQWKEIQKREFITSLMLASRDQDNEATFAKYNMPDLLAGGTPKPHLVYNLALSLQAQTLARSGINPVLV